jgi:hypothetical protein
MAGNKFFAASVIIIGIVIFLAAAPGVGIANTYIMVGKISAIDLAYDTVVVEVPLGSKMFTVGGPLSDEAGLMRDNQPAGLNDFKVGERVTVKWHSTPDGHVIDRLVLK